MPRFSHYRRSDKWRYQHKDARERIVKVLVYPRAPMTDAPDAFDLAEQRYTIQSESNKTIYTPTRMSFEERRAEFLDRRNKE